MLHLRKRFIFTLVLVCTGWLGSIPAYATDVVEFYNTILDNYFITADTNEATAIDGGSAGPGWTRTGETFKSGGSTPVCRFYGSQSPGPNSHFYTVDTNECQGLKDNQFSANDPRKLTVKSWNFEALDFISTPPTGDQCPVGTMPVYRAYNNGFSRGVDSNHRISINPAAIAQVLGRGWINEGVVMCAESQDVDTQQPATNVTVFTDSGNPLLMSFIPKGGKQTTLFGKKNAEGAATAIDGMYIQETPTSKHLILFDGDGRPSKITTADGATMTFSWGSGGQVSINYITADGLNQVSLPLPQLVFPLTQPVATFALSSLKEKDVFDQTGGTTLEVSVHESGTPVSGATVWAKFALGGGSVYLPEHSPGKYSAVVYGSPSPISPGAVEGLCNKIAETSEDTCMFLTPISESMLLGGCLRFGAAAPACEVFFTGALAACTPINIIEASGTRPSWCILSEAAVSAIIPIDGAVINVEASKYAAKGTATTKITGRETKAEVSVELTCPPPQVAHDGRCRGNFELILSNDSHDVTKCAEIAGLSATSCGAVNIMVECRGDGCANETFSITRTIIPHSICVPQDNGQAPPSTENIEGRHIEGAGPLYTFNFEWVKQRIFSDRSCENSWKIELTITSSGGFTKVFNLSS